MRSVLRVGAIGLIVLVVAAGIALYAQRDKLLARISDAALEALSAQLGSDITVSNVDLRLIPLTLIIEGLSVPSPSTEVPEVPLTVRRILVRPSLISLLTQTPVLRWVLVEEPRLHLVVGPNNASNLLRPPPPTTRQPEDRQRPPVLIKRIDIEAAELSFQSPSIGVSLRNAEASLHPDLVTRHLAATFAAPGGSITVGDRTMPFQATQIAVTVDRDVLRIQNAKIGAHGLQFDGHGSVRLDEAPTVDLAASVSLDLKPVFDELLPSHHLSGHLDASAEIRGPLADPSVGGTVSARHVAYREVPIGDMTATVEERAGRITFRDASGTVLDGSARGHGSLNLSVVPATWSAFLETDQLDPIPSLRRLFPQLTALPAHRLSGPVSLQGRGLSWEEIDADARVRVTAPADLTTASEDAPASRVHALLELIVSGEVPLTMRDGHVIITQASVATKTGVLTSSGSIRPDGEAELTIDADGVAIAELGDALRLPFAVAGTGAFRGQLSGPLRSPRVDGQARIGDFVLRGHPAGALAATLSYEDRRLQIRKTVWRRGEARYDTVGTLDWTGPMRPAFDLVATLRGARVDEILPIAFRELPIRTAADGTFWFIGAPKEFIMTANLTLRDGSLWGQSFDRGDVLMTIDRERVRFIRTTLYRGESHVRGRGAIAYRDGYDAQFDAPNLHLQTLDLFGLNELPISGTASVSLSTRGTFDRPEFHGAAAISYLEGAGQPLGKGHATIDVADRRVALTVNLDDQHAQLKADMAWEPDFPVTATLTVTDSSLVPLIRPWLPPIFLNMNAALSGSVSLTGPLLDPLRWRANARIERLRADVGEYTLENQDELVVSLHSGSLSIESCRLRGTDTILTVTGGVDLFKSYNLLVVGEADVRLTRLFVPTVTSGRGKTYLVLKISDAWATPQIQGGVTIQNARITTKALQQPIYIDTVGLFFNERQVLLESLVGSVGDGRITANGRIELTGFRPDRFGILVDVAGAQFPLTPTLTPTFSGQLVLTGTPDEHSLRGELRVDRAVYDTRIELQTWILEFRKQAETQGDIPVPEITRGVKLNIHFVGRDNVGIKNNVADVDLEVDLFLRGTVDRPYVIGQIKAKDGRLKFRNNQLEIQSTTVDFDDPTRFDPKIDLHAITTIRDYAITIRLTGTIKQFDLALTSDPSLTETDILALLTIGRTAEEASQSQASITQDEAVSIAMQELLQEGVQRLPGMDAFVDVFEIDPDFDPTLNTSAPRISVGKQLLDNRLTLRYSTTLDQAARQGIRVEYELSRKLFLSGEQDSTRGFGGDLRYRFEFR